MYSKPPSLSQRETYNQHQQAKSCLNKIPSVNCRTNVDCQAWLTQNCSQQDIAVTRTYCDVKEGNQCIFMGLEHNAQVFSGN